MNRVLSRFNRLGLAFAPIKDRVKQLQCIVKEHLLSIEPQIVAAIPPPTKRNLTLLTIISCTYICTPTPPFELNSIVMQKAIWIYLFVSLKGGIISETKT